MQLGLGIPEYLHGRLVSHCPGVSLAALQQILRDAGATLLCDGFDRVAAAPRKRLDAELSTFIRDYPKAQVFVLSRSASRPSLALPLLELEALTDDEMRAMERAILHADDKHYSIIGLMSETLRTLCKNSLLLDRALGFWKLNHIFPAQIGDLFQSWRPGSLTFPAVRAPAIRCHEECEPLEARPLILRKGDLLADGRATSSPG